jgi:hypothetical protein
MTGHDFLQIGTGSKANTNWPNQPLTFPAQQNEIIENFPGRCYYVSTDQDGNFRVGDFFLVEQATGTATLDASAFNLSGLASLRLGTLGAELGVAINEFSADVNLGSDFSRDSAVPTQLAVKTYVDNSVGAGILRSTPTIGVSLLTSTGTTATVTSFVTNNVYVGDTIVVTGATQANYNGTFVVTAIDTSARTFSYIMSGTAVSPATGAISVERKQRMTSDLDIVGSLKIRPTWNNSENLEALHISATDTQSGPDTTLIDVKVGGTSKFKVDKDGNITTAGSLTVAGTTTTINSVDLTISDKTVVVASGATDSSTANDAGLQLGSSNLSFKYNHANTRWNLPNAGLNVGGPYRINGTEVLSSDTLGNDVIYSSLTSLGNLSSLAVNGVSKLQSVSEILSVRSPGQSGTQIYDFNTSAIFFHPSVSGNITAAVTNVPTDSSRAHSIVIVFAQGATPYSVTNTIGINGISITVKWLGSIAPSPVANRNEAWVFTLLNKSTTSTPDWIVFGQKSEFAG